MIKIRNRPSPGRQQSERDLAPGSASDFDFEFTRLRDLRVDTGDSVERVLRPTSNRKVQISV